MPKQRLRMKRIDTVGFVEAGDNPGAHIMLWKSKNAVAKDDHDTFADIQSASRAREDVWSFTSDLSEALMNAFRNEEGDRASQIRQSLAEFTAAVEAAMPQWLAGDAAKSNGGHKVTEGRIAAVLSTIGKRLGWAAADVDSMVVEIAKTADLKDDTMENLTDEQQEAFDALTKRAEEAEAQVAKLDPKTVNPIDKVEDDDARAAIQKRLDEADERAAKADARVQKLEDDRVRERFIAKAQDLGHIGMTGDDHGEILRKIAGALDEDEAKKFDALLSALNEQALTSDLFKEIGSGSKGADPTTDEVNKLVSELRAAKPTLTDALARAEVYKARPDLLNALLTED